MKARDVMVSPVITAKPSSTVKEVAKLMVERRISAVPVVDENGYLLGVITRANLLDEWVPARYNQTEQTPAAELPVITYDLIDRKPITAYPSESARGAAERMAECGGGYPRAQRGGRHRRRGHLAAWAGL